MMADVPLLWRWVAVVRESKYHVYAEASAGRGRRERAWDVALVSIAAARSWWEADIHSRPLPSLGIPPLGPVQTLTAAEAADMARRGGGESEGWTKAFWAGHAHPSLVQLGFFKQVKSTSFEGSLISNIQRQAHRTLHG
jgi:hypothetical protein